MPKFCPECGGKLPTPDAKYCSDCGTRLEATTASDTSFPRRGREHEPPGCDYSEENLTSPIRVNVYDLGVKLEETTADIFQRMGYHAERRKRMPTRSGATAEIDILLQRGTRVKAVECKNYDPSRSVGVSDLHVFRSKLEDTGIYAGIFVTNTCFSEDSEKLADSVGIELWDGETLREKFFAYSIGRLRNPSLVQDPILPLQMDFASASRLNLKNSNAVHLFSAVLLYHPYIQVKYRLQVSRKDQNGKLHRIQDEGSYVVDALDGDIIDRERGVLEGIGGLLNKSMRRQAREDKMISEDLKDISTVMRPVLETPEYKVSVAEPEIKESEAIKIVQHHVVVKNTRTVEYDVKARGETETRHLKMVPRMNEVTIRGSKLIYVPKWNLEYECCQTSYSREVLASSGRFLTDEITRCSRCKIKSLSKQSAAVCEVCGRPLCEKHSHLEGRWLCEDHISDALRAQLKNTGLRSLFKKW